MLLQGLTASPEFEVHNENDRRAFDHFRLRPDPVVLDIVLSSRHRFVLFKPLCDSHRVDELLALDTPMPGRAIWAYRSVDGTGCARRWPSSATPTSRCSGRSPPARATAAGRPSGCPDQSLALIGSFDYDRMTPASAAALFWLVRNSLYFDLGLDQRADVLLSSYDAPGRRPHRP